MSTDQRLKLVRDWGARLRKDALALRVVKALHERRDDVWRTNFGLFADANPNLQRTSDSEIQQESKAHCNENTEVIVKIARARPEMLGPDPFAFVRGHAIFRSRRQFPLAASLQLYRQAHKGYWSVMREYAVELAPSKDEAIKSLLTLSDFLNEYFDVLASTLTEAYVAEEKQVMAQRARAQVSLVDDLLSGLHPRDAEARELCVRSGIRLDASMAVVVIRPLLAAADHVLADLAEFVDRTLPETAFGRLIDIRNGEVTAIVSSDGDAAKMVARALSASRMDRRFLNGSAAGVGIGLEAAEIARLPQSYEEARLALGFADTSRLIVHFADIDLMDFLVRRPDAAAFRLIPDWVERFREADREKDGELSRTVQTFADCSFNVKQTAQRLGLHANSIYFRLNSIARLTGVDPRSFAGMSLLLTTLRLVEQTNLRTAEQ
jgi:sugar diacid utilization regulator